MREQALRLGDCAKVISGYAFKSKDFVDEGVPVLKIANIKHEHVVFEGVQYLPPDFLNIDDKFKVKFGDVMICLTGSHISQPNSVVGRVAMYRHERLALLNQRAGRIIVNDTKRLDKDFLYYFLRQEKVMHDLALNAGGAANQANISPKDVERIELPNIDIFSQKSISSTLKAYDDLIENNKRRIELLEESARQLYKEWFVRFRFPGHEHVKIIDGVPDGWTAGCVGDTAKVFSGYAFKSKDWLEEGNPVIKIKNITSTNTVDVSDCQCVDDNVAEKADKFKLSAGDMLIAMTGATVGKVGLMPISKRTFYLNQRVGKFDSKIGRDVTPLLLSFFNSEKAQSSILNLAGGAAQPNISAKQIESIVLPIPPKPLLNTFLDETEKLFTLRLNLVDQNFRLEQARDLLLPKLMNGEIAV